jgi:hypothetical protein
MVLHMESSWAWRPGRCLVHLAVAVAALCAHAQEVPSPKPAASAAELRATHQRLTPLLANNEFRRPLVIESTEGSGALAGDIHAVMDYPFGTVRTAFGSVANWCDVLILHVNTKYCRAEGAGLEVQMGQKTPEALDPGAQMAFTFRVLPGANDYFRAELTATRGPLSTRNYRIGIEAVALPGNQTFLHLSYTYESGLAGRIAMSAYLATGGRGKVGFSNTGLTHDGRPIYVEGVLGLVERNTMRYYLALDAFLGAQSVPAGERFEKRIDSWFSASEMYARQLHDMDRATYVDMKREEYRRQQAAR